MLLDVRIVVIRVRELPQATAWYRRILGFAPHQLSATCASFNGGGYDLRLELETRRTRARVCPDVYWRVHDLERTLVRLVRAGAVLHSPPEEMAAIGLAASVKDPFGSVLRLVQERCAGIALTPAA